MKKKNIMVVIAIILCAVVGLGIFLLINNKSTAKKFDTFSNCKASVDGIEKLKYTNLDFSDCNISKISKVDTDEACSFTTRYLSTNDIKDNRLEEKRSKIVNMYYNLYNKDVSELDYSSEEGSISCSTEDVYYCISINNTFAMLDVSRYTLPVVPMVERKDVYRIDSMTDISSVKGNKMSLGLSDAIKMCDEMANNKLVEFSIGDSFELNNAYLIENLDGKQLYVIRYRHNYKGISLNDVGNAATSEYGFVKMNWLEFEVDDQGIAGVRSFYSTTFMEEQEIEDNLLTFGSACQTLSDFLAPYGKYTVESIDIEYCAVTYSDEANSQSEFTYHPMWAYYVKSGEADHADLDPRMVMYVDMIDGTIYVIDTITNEPWFSVNPNKNID